MKLLPWAAVAAIPLLLVGCQSDRYHGYQSEAYGPPEAANVPLDVSQESACMLSGVGSFSRDEIEESVRRNPWLLKLSEDLRNELFRCIDTARMLDSLYELPEDLSVRTRREFELLVRSIDQIGAGDTSRFTPHCPEAMYAISENL